jgi:transposase
MKAGDRVKTDRRDAVTLADLVRARATADCVLGNARLQPQGFLLRHGRVCAGQKGWIQALSAMADAAASTTRRSIGLQDYSHSVRSIV